MSEHARVAAPVWMTRSGLPLRISLEWPFHRSGSGADFQVLHGRIELEGSSGLHALVALQLTVTVREVLPSLEPADAEAPAINALRKEVDTKQIEFMKTPKRVPVPFNSRMYDFKRNKWAFGRADEQQVRELLTRKAYWQSKLGEGKMRLLNAVDALYLDRPVTDLREAARRLAGEGWIELESDEGRALPALMARGEEIEAEMQRAREELERKHAFERG